MMNQSLYSAQEEPYTLHIDRCLERFEVVYPVFEDTLKRIFHIPDSEKIKEEMKQMVLFHDLGKLTKRWQERLGKGPLPPHATVGAAYLWKSMPNIPDLKESIAFAVAIHHTDSGLLGDNIERPDVQAILKEIVNYTGEIIWDKRAYKLPDTYFPPSAHKLTVYDLKDMAGKLRLWARGGSIREQHKRRLQATLSHHILKLCDISAALERKKYKSDDERGYYGGWLMVENIKDYVEKISIRNRYLKLQSELTRWINILKERYNPQKIIVFGSFVNGKIKEWSDIDVIIIKDDLMKKPFLARTKEILSILQPKVGVDILVYTSEEFEQLSQTRPFFKEEILKKGKVIYER